MRPAHALTWTGDLWECTCGFETDQDYRARRHYFGDNLTGSQTTALRMENE